MLLKGRIGRYGKTSILSLRSQRVNLTTVRKPLTKTVIPIDESSNTLRHLQFTPRMSFEDGLAIQEKFVKAQLDIKELQSKIKRRVAEIEDQYENASINENEQKILDQIMSMKPNPLLLTFEFDPTYTGGKRVKKTITDQQIQAFENFVPEVQKNNPKPKFVQVERGGQITYHGPGQLVAYIILDLKTFKDFPAKCLVAAIEQSTINALKHTTLNEKGDKLDLDAFVTENTGVWTSTNKKIASIGIHVRRSITSHGVAVNIDTDLSYMKRFEMCGLKDSIPTSIRNENPNAHVSVQQFAIEYGKQLAKVLGIQTIERMQIMEDDLKNMLEKN
ncbi:hypothetical protein RNJ44_03176 [Nakaseomyces bracarensis]|uniref:Octanoyltransferase n=1 Tax=Nakaseomyces bracarensis TaxID=273131 RepID=A0ABR4NZ24_9SACH